MEKLKTDWRIVKSSSARGEWLIESRMFMKNDDGAWELLHNWNKHSRANGKKSALNRSMILRDRGDRVFWDGGPMRLGIALISSHQCGSEA